MPLIIPPVQVIADIKSSPRLVEEFFQAHTAQNAVDRQGALSPRFQKGARRDEACRQVAVVHAGDITGSLDLPLQIIPIEEAALPRWERF